MSEATVNSAAPASSQPSSIEGNSSYSGRTLTDAAKKNVVKAALTAAVQGKSVEEAVYGNSTAGKKSSAAPAESVTEGDTNVSTQESVQSESEAQPSNQLSDDNSSTQMTESDVEDLFITDEKGRRKITVDFKDREKIRQYVKLALGGARKWQAERDQERKWRSEKEPKLQELESAWNAVETAFKKDGVKGLVNLLSGKETGYDEHFAAEAARRDARAKASPSELERLELADRLEAEARARKEIEEKLNTILNQSKEKEEAAQKKSLESMTHPAFEKYRFAGRLGNQTAEERLDKAIWKEAREQLASYPDDVELTSSLVDKTFREVSETFKSVIANQADKKADSIVTQKKQHAAESAALKATKGFQGNVAKDQFMTDIRKGNLASALTSVLRGKIKLG